jgi:hypothetical protein
VAAPDPCLPDACRRCGHDAFVRLGPDGRLASPPLPGSWWCEACDLPARFQPGTLAVLDGERLPEACRALRYSLPNQRVAVLDAADDYDVEDYAYEYHGDADGPSEDAVANFAATPGPWVRVFVGDNADVPVFAVPELALEEAED